MAPALRPEGEPLEAVIDAATTVLRFPGPACIVDDARVITLSNALWDAVITAAGGAATLPVELVGSVFVAERTGRPQRALAAVEVDAGTLDLDVTYLPGLVDGRASVIVLATDLSLIETLHGALIDSRDLYRDLALCSSDATFEIDSTGRFTYLGPCGFLGHADFELHGTAIGDLVAERSVEAAERLFESREPIWEAELWFRSVSGDQLCFLISAMPTADSEGEWLGLRGVGRDITELRAREQEIARARRSQRDVEAVFHAMRSEADPMVMIQTGAVAMIDMLGVAACLVVAVSNDAPADPVLPHLVVRCESDATGHKSDLAMVSDEALANLCDNALTTGSFGHGVGQISGFAAILAATRYEGRVNGALIFLRHLLDGTDDAVLWSADDRHLLRVAADQIGVALAQIDIGRRTQCDRSREAAQ